MNLQSWSILLGALTPMLVSLVVQHTWSKTVKEAMAVALAVVVGLTNVLVNGSVSDWHNTIGAIGVVLAASQTAYVMLWKPTGIAPAVEEATSIGSEPPPD